MNKVKGKKSHSNLESESDESNHQAPNLDLSLMRQPIATSICGFEEVLRAYEAGTNEVCLLLAHLHRFASYSWILFFLRSCVNYYRESVT